MGYHASVFDATQIGVTSSMNRVHRSEQGKQTNLQTICKQITVKGKGASLVGSKPTCKTKDFSINTKAQVKPTKETTTMSNKHASKIESELLGLWVAVVFVLHLGFAGQNLAQPYVLE